MKLRSLNIAPRAFLSFGFLTLLVLGLGFFSLSQSHLIKDGEAVIVGNVLPSVRTLGQIRADLLSLRMYNQSLMLATSIADAEAVRATLAEERAGLQQHVYRFDTLDLNEQGQDIYGTLKQQLSRYLDTEVRYLKALDDQNDEELLKLTGNEGEIARSEEALIATVKALSDVTEAEISRLTQASTTSYQHSLWVTMAVMTLAFSATLLLAWRFTRSLTGPLNRALLAAERIAANDLADRVVVDGHDEAGRLLMAMARMQDNLRHTLDRLSQSSAVLAMTSGEMSAVTTDALQGIQRQNAELEQAATAVNEMTAAVEEVARNAAEASTATQDSRHSTEAGQQRVAETLHTIHTLHASVITSSEQIDGLAGEVQRISSVLDVIRAIAEQTNLLALNAAIEAARAGDAGRGFAVVADAVRTLAARTQKSTTEIEEMVGSVQGRARKAVAAMTTSNKQANACLGVAQAAGEALVDISRHIVQISERNLSISAATEEQAQVAREVAHNLTSIRDLSVRNAERADQTAAGSSDLARLAIDLRGEVRQFKL